MRSIKYIAYNDHSGYAVAAARTMRGLIEAGVPLNWTPLAPGRSGTSGLWYGVEAAPSALDPALDPHCLRAVDHDVVIVHTVPDYFPEWLARERGRFRVAYTTWEADRLPVHWPGVLNAFDLVLVPCEWNRRVMRRDGVTAPIAVVPHISEPIDARGEALPLAAGPETTVFYTINTWDWRKAMPETIEAYLRAFTRHDDTLLVVKTDRHDRTRKGLHWRFPPRVSRRVRRLRRRHRNAPRVQLIDRPLSGPQVHALHRQGHCFLSLTHGEGWGLGAFDAARAGNQIVITGFGGHCDYLPAGHATLLDYRRVPVAYPVPGIPFQPHQCWAEADMDQAVDALRRVRPEPNPALAEHIAHHYNRRTVTHRLLEALARHVH
ncbi:glycosyltransferase family 1 protein [Alkalilimnicola ehrlichii MLHE-1]|uniref:Glycosyl transferase, group 1 n=1 Tax=Alkalilimnicola ehrlichii (strain ATCC BAA-1101 / DSM 17681 / MLHE-1) TaxID=187272 RepID=Q0A646_ALKEH|nr:glycosyltransferase family 1 protein [Alkalilimnicola ehrlichii]ABI57691.1 hypothetical protein Mlg_2351 [Alkalilimnicola ehrlichii MLHE-1]